MSVPVPWISPASVTGMPTGYRAFVAFGSIVGMVALPYGFWTYLLGLAIVGAMAHQGVVHKRLARK